MDEQIDKIEFPKKRKRAWFCGMCGKQYRNAIDLEYHVTDEYPKRTHNKEILIYRVDNAATMQIY